MEQWTYPALIEGEAGDYVVRFPDISEAITGGETLEEARALASDALEEAILGRLARGEPVPRPSRVTRGQEAVELDPLTAGRAAVATILTEAHIPNVRLAGLMKVDEKVVRRILDGKGGVTMRNVTQALRVLGAKPRLTVDLPKPASAA
jgi:antitoxin HicB